MQATLSPLVDLPRCIPYDDERLDCRLLAMAEDLCMLMRFGYFNGLDHASAALLEEHIGELMDASADAFLMLPRVPWWRRLGRSFGRGRVR